MEQALQDPQTLKQSSRAVISRAHGAGDWTIFLTVRRKSGSFAILKGFTSPITGQTVCPERALLAPQMTACKIRNVHRLHRLYLLFAHPQLLPPQL
jgi:hypothetical protein